MSENLINPSCVSILCVNMHNTSLAHKDFGKDFIPQITELTAKYTDENQVCAFLALLNTLVCTLSTILQVCLTSFNIKSSQFPFSNALNSSYYME